MNYFARQNMILSKPAADVIKNLRILVAGVGAGGNEVLKDLVLMGFGHLTIVDFDHVEDSNLSRTTLFRKEDIGKSKALVAAERLKEMALHDNPKIVGLHGNLITDFGKSLFLEHDIVICCVDTQKARAYINDMCVLTKTPFFEMGFQNYDVEISFFAPEGTMTQRDGTVIDSLPPSDGYFPKMNGTFPVCLRESIGFGYFDEKRNSCSGFKVKDTNLIKIPTIQVSAAMAGVLIAMELVKYLDGKDTLKNKMLYFFGRTYETMICNFTRNAKCTIHDEVFDLITQDVKKGDTLREILTAMQNEYGGRVILTLPDDFIISGKCHICGKEIKINKRAKDIWDEERWCDDCRKEFPNYEHILNYGNEFVKVPKEVSLLSEDWILNKTLHEVGVPKNDILECVIIKDDSIEYKYVFLKTK